MSPFMTTPFNELLASALAPITLISGVGLLMLSMSARYNHATTRIRLLMNERLDPKLSDDERADIDEEIDFIFHRAGLLRNGELCVVLSAVVSGLMVALCVLEESTGVHADFVNSMLLVAAVGLIVLSTVFLSLEIRLSLKAIKVVVSKLPPMDEALTMQLRQGPLRPWRRGTSPMCSTKRDTLRTVRLRTRSERSRRSAERQASFFLSCHRFAFVDIISFSWACIARAAS